MQEWERDDCNRVRGTIAIEHSNHEMCSVWAEKGFSFIGRGKENLKDPK